MTLRGRILPARIESTAMNDKIAELALILLGSLGLMVARGIHTHFRRQAGHGGGNRAPDMELRMLFALAVIALVVLPLIDLFLPWVDFADTPFSQPMAWAGVSIGAASVLLFCRTVLDSIRYRDNDTIEGGLYRFVRHPFYTALLLWAIAQLLLLQNWLGNAAALTTFAAMYGLRMPRDEQNLLERFGHRYLDYMGRTGALLPRWNAWRQR
jgi:protein-S-isoprenylcysteine O-methyltransferase Ste14